MSEISLENKSMSAEELEAQLIQYAEESFVPKPFDSIEELQSTFDDEMIEYLESTLPEERTFQAELGIHFHQLQKPVVFDEEEPIAVVKSDEKKPLNDFLDDENNSKNGDNTLTVKQRKMLTKKGYPKVYADPTHAEYEETDDKWYYYFDIDKSLRKYHLMGITKIISLKKLEDVTYNKDFFDDFAQKQHAKAERLTNMSAIEQYKHDKRTKMVLGAVSATILLIVYLIATFSVIPSNKFEDATALLAEEDYEQAYYLYDSLGTKYDSYVYAKYCEGEVNLQLEQYDEAIECFSLLTDYQDYFGEETLIEDMISECYYSKAIDLFSESNFEDAKDIFKTIYEYKDATDYYYRCSVEIAEQYYLNDDLYSAVDNFYEPGMAGYEDSYDRLIAIADEIYDSSSALYELENFGDALEGFTFLADYSYKDSKNMTVQCEYKYALNLYEAKKYEDAKEEFSKITTYKDSLSLMKECIYNIASQTKNISSVESIQYYETIKDYKDVNTYLTSPELLLYGRWEITEQNSVQIDPVEFSFYGGGLFYTQTSLNGIAISTDATPQPYSWDGEKFSAINGQYTITIEDVDYGENSDSEIDKVLLTCSSSSNTYTYLCTRTMTYTDMIEEDDDTTENDTSNLTLNQKIELCLEEYVEKKTDGIAYVNGEEVQVTTEEEKLKNAIKESSEGEETIEEADEE